MTTHQLPHSPSPNTASYGYMAAHASPYHQQNVPLGHLQQRTDTAPLTTPSVPCTHQQQPTQQTAISSLPTRSPPTIDMYNDSDPQHHCHYLYQVGFLQGQFYDTTYDSLDPSAFQDFSAAFTSAISVTVPFIDAL